MSLKVVTFHKGRMLRLYFQMPVTQYIAGRLWELTVTPPGLANGRWLRLIKSPDH